MKRSWFAIVVGGGPAGQKAAICAAKAGHSVLLVDADQAIGGECVHRGTIPSKTLRESAVYLEGLRSRTEGVLDLNLGADVKIASLMRRLETVRRAHEGYQEGQLERNGVQRHHARARFTSPNELELTSPDGSVERVRAEIIVLATGSRPRNPPEVPIDHEHVLDSDSILSLIYLPHSLTVLGAGVIAAEFASIFAALGVEVTMVDKYERPVGFLDPELTDGFVRTFEQCGGRFLPKRKIESVAWDGLSAVVTTLEGGEVLRSEKLLCAMGRVANVRGLGLAAAGLETNARGLIDVDEHLRTAHPHIYAAGDVVGPPALATTSMEQGRRAMMHALGESTAEGFERIPVGVYTIPEMASIGLSEAQVIERFGEARVGRARFAELARGQINGNRDGLLKLVTGPDGRVLLGAQVLGEGAAELIAVAQIAIEAEMEIDNFVERVFNFPTLAEGYRVAALEILDQRARVLRRSA